MKLILHRPELKQRTIGLLRRADLPIKLRREVIAPTRHPPLFRIGVELFVRIESLYLLGPFVTQAKWADAKFHLFLLALDAFVDTPDQLVHILTAPIIAAQFASGLLVLLPRFVVRKICALQ